jgi:hypothetical protein
MRFIMKKLLNSCQKSTELIDKQLSTALTTTERMQLNAHKAMCKTCNSYEKQSKILDAALSKWLSITNSKKGMMETTKKQNIITAIKNIETTK